MFAFSERHVTMCHYNDKSQDSTAKHLSYDGLFH